MIQAKRSFVKCRDWFIGIELVILSYAFVCHHPSVSLNKEKVSREISENKIAVCEKTQGLRSGNFSDLNSACSTVLVPVKIFQFQDMHYENRFLGTFQGHSKRPISLRFIGRWFIHMVARFIILINKWCNAFYIMFHYAYFTFDSMHFIFIINKM
jgi:hypothetical protein